MEQEIEIETEVKELGKRLASFTEDLPPTVRKASEPLIEKLGFAGGDIGGWEGQFSPLTLLYPMLQGEAFSAISIQVRRELTLAHGLLLIHSVIEDRWFDGQASLEPAEALLSKHALLGGLSILHRLAPDSARLDGWIVRLNRAYAEGQLAKYREAAAMSVGEPDRMLCDIAYGRAALGFHCVAAHAILARHSDATIEELLAAYRVIVSALQWADDLEDWMDDLAAGRENLVLHILGSAGIPLPHGGQDGQDLKRVRSNLILSGVYMQAQERAIDLFEDAAVRQRALGCRQLSRLIEDLSARFFRKCEARISEIGSRILLEFEEPFLAASAC